MHFETASCFWFLLTLSVAGYAQDGITSTCDANANCVGYYSGFNCTCNSGYKGSNGGCINIDECVEIPNVCEEAETCNDIIGSYNCTCGDVETICHEAAVCANGTNTTSCFCIEGFTGNGTFCYDIDECIERLDNCSVDALCSNTVGSYGCTCYSGYEGDGFVCSDVDECEREIHDCVLPLTCNNTKGSFDCICGTDGICHVNGYCADVNNDTSCYCNVGFTGTGLKCADIDECASPNNCHKDAHCVNAPGSYRCICNTGFEGNGIECSSGTVITASLGLFLTVLSASLLSAELN